MFPIEMRGLDGGDEELTPVGVFASIGHTQQVWTIMLLDEVFILELGAVDGFTAGAVATGEITALKHELGDDTMEAGTAVAETLLSGAKSAKVFGSLWDDVVVEIEDDAGGRAIVDGNVEVALRVGRRSRSTSTGSRCRSFNWSR